MNSVYALSAENERLPTLVWYDVDYLKYDLMQNPTITFLGTGTADATKYYHSCFVIREDDETLLMDAGGGNGILVQLEKADIPLESIRSIFITHKHIDHIFGVFWVLRFLGAKIAKGKADGLTLYGSEKVLSVIREFSPLFLKSKVTDLFGNKIVFHSIDNENPIAIGKWTLLPFNTMSEKEEQFGFRLTLGNKKEIVCLGDEPYKKELLERCRDADILIHNAYCLERDAEDLHPHDMHHSSVKDACEVAEATHAKKLLLWHTEDRKTFGQRKELYEAEAIGFFSGETLVPNDLESVEV